MPSLIRRYSVNNEVLADVAAALREHGMDSTRWWSALSGVRFWSGDLEAKLGDIYPTSGNQHSFGEIEFAREREFWLAQETYYFGKESVPEEHRVRPLLHSNYSPNPRVREVAQTFADKYGFQVEHHEGTTKINAAGPTSSILSYKSSTAVRTSTHGSLPVMKDYVINGVLSYVEHCMHYRESIGPKKLRISA